MEVIIFLLGTGLGSILNMLWFKLKYNEPIFARRISCSTCKKEILPIDMLPVWSWITRRGHCRWCGTAFSKQHMILEGVVGILSVSVYCVFG